MWHGPPSELPGGLCLDPHGNAPTDHHNAVARARPGNSSDRERLGDGPSEEPTEGTCRRRGRGLEQGDGVGGRGGELASPVAAPGDGGHGGLEVDDLAEEWGFVVGGAASAGTGRGGQVGDDEEGASGVGNPREAAEVVKEGEGAVVGGGRRRDQMRRVEGERQLRQRVPVPHRAGYCTSVGAGGGAVWSLDPHRLPSPISVFFCRRRTVHGAPPIFRRRD